MAELSCTVTSCVHNDDHCCCKGDILVEGKTAETSCDTCCGSFKEKSGSCCKNSLEHPTHSIEVDCEATNCVHNESCRCKAGHIGIAGGEVCDCRETECSSFQKR